MDNLIIASGVIFGAVLALNVYKITKQSNRIDALEMALALNLKLMKDLADLQHETAKELSSLSQHIVDLSREFIEDDEKGSDE